jgi:polyhydroxybutyrate depolymerase
VGVTRSLFVCVAAALLIGGCRGSEDRDDTTPSVGITIASETTSPIPVDTALSGADGPRTCADSLVGDSNQTLHSSDLDRTYILHIPPQYDGSTRLPLVLNLHGFGSNARNQAAYSRLPQKADEEGFIVVTPDGAGTPQQWNNAQLPSGVDDVAFIRDLLDHLEATLCIDPARIYAAGISNGAAFSSRLACNMPDRIAGIALIAATIYPIICDSESPTPVIAFHGTADRCVPYEGGTTMCGRGNLPVQPADTPRSGQPTTAAIRRPHAPSSPSTSAHSHGATAMRTPPSSSTPSKTAVTPGPAPSMSHAWAP